MGIQIQRMQGIWVGMQGIRVGMQRIEYIKIEKKRKKVDSIQFSFFSETVKKKKKKKKKRNYNCNKTLKFVLSN